MKVIFFESDKFNLSVEGDDFINPGCFGEDFANWLKPKLEQSHVSVNDIYQEDWGWEIACSDGDTGYYLSVGGIQEEDNSDLGEWRVMFTKRRGFFDSILGKNKMSNSERILSVVQKILEKNNFNKIKLEENAYKASKSDLRNLSSFLQKNAKKKTDYTWANLKRLIKYLSLAFLQCKQRQTDKRVWM
jgi:hypothetical protein